MNEFVWGVAPFVFVLNPVGVAVLATHPLRKMIIAIVFPLQDDCSIAFVS